MLRFFIRPHGWWSLPVLGPVARWLYLQTMRGVPQVAWITGPFDTNSDYIRAGRTFIRTWLRFTEHEVVLHPFGSVITNLRSRRAFCALVEEDESDGMAWMLLRLGYSATPPRSHRRPEPALYVQEAS